MVDPDNTAGDIVIAALCVGRTDGERLLGGVAAVAFGYDKLAESFLGFFSANK